MFLNLIRSVVHDATHLIFKFVYCQVCKIFVSWESKILIVAVVCSSSLWQYFSRRVSSCTFYVIPHPVKDSGVFLFILEVEKINKKIYTPKKDHFSSNFFFSFTCACATDSGPPVCRDP